MIKQLLLKTFLKSRFQFFLILFLVSFQVVNANNTLNNEKDKKVKITSKNKSKFNPITIARNRIVYLNNNGIANITPQDINNGSSNDNGELFLSIDISTFDCSNVGENIVTLTASDNNGNTDTATSIVTVVDVQLPNLVTRRLTVSLDSNGSVIIDPSMIDNGTTDNCGIESLELSKSNFDCSNVGNNTVRFTATDVNGNTSFKDVTVKIIDNEKPMIVEPENITVEVNSNNCSYTFQNPLTVTATDNCGIEKITGKRRDGLSLSDPFPIGNTTITWTATDINGNMSGSGGGMKINLKDNKESINTFRATTTQIITVVDNIPPTFSTIESHTLFLDASGNTTFNTNNFDTNSITDNCEVETITFDKTNFSCSDIGEQTITVTATDIYGNSSTGPINILIVDNIAPVVLTKDISIDLDASGNASITTQMIDNGTSDNCNFILSLDKIDFNCSDLGENTVLLTATDESGNTASANATVTINNSVLLNAITKNITVTLDNSGNASITPQMIDNGSTGSCGFSLSLDKQNFDCSNVGIENTVTLTATDNNGHTSSATAVVTVIDNISPTVVTKNITVELDNNGNVVIAPEDVLIFSNSNESTEECTVTAAESHAMWLSKYIKNNDDDDDDDNDDDDDDDDDEDDDDDDDDDDDRFSKSTYQNARFIFNAKKGSLITNSDGTARITGKLINTQNPKDKWKVTLKLKKARNWNEWSALGRSWKGNSSVVGDRYLNWTYYEMSNKSKLKGLGINKGKTINLSHAPADKKYGFQLGDRANDKNTNYGLSGWFFYKNRYGNWVQGDFNLDVSDCIENPTETIITNDNCAIESYTLDKDTFNCNNVGENIVNVTVTDINGNSTTKPVTVNVVGTNLNVEIEDFTLVNGQKKNTIFLGYKESVHLCPIVTSEEDVSYQWTDDSGNIISTEAFPKVSPKVSTTYTLTITNQSGCSASASIDVCVIDARAYNEQGQYLRNKVSICHHTYGHNGTKHVTINISVNALSHHIRNHGEETNHYDTLGACNATCVTEEIEVVEPTLELSLYPNPSCGVFYAKIKNLQENATVVLYNMQGIEIQRKYIQCVRDGENKVLMGSYSLRPGSYIVKVFTDGKVLTETMIVTSSNH